MGKRPKYSQGCPNGSAIKRSISVIFVLRHMEKYIINCGKRFDNSPFSVDLWLEKDCHTWQKVPRKSRWIDRGGKNQSMKELIGGLPHFKHWSDPGKPRWGNPSGQPLGNLPGGQRWNQATNGHAVWGLLGRLLIRKSGNHDLTFCHCSARWALFSKLIVTQYQP